MSALLLSLLTAACPTRASWPTTDWPSDIDRVAAAKATEIGALETYAFTLTGADGDRVGLRTDSVLIIKGGNLIYERYGRGYGPTNRHISWSVAKSFSTMMAGVAVNKGVLSVSDSISKYLTVRDDLKPITVQHLMEFGSGMHWQEGYEKDPYQTSSVISMLFGVGHQDMVSFVLAEKKEAEPGTVFEYSTGEATLVSSIANNAAQPTLGKDWMWTELFNKTGMGGVIFQGDTKLNPSGGSYIFATPRDFARFGYLYLNDGCWDGERLLPDGWVKSSTTMSDTFKVGAADSETEPNGWMWWLNQVPPKIGMKPWPDVPDDAFAAEGHWGQFVIVVPSLDVVIVRTADDRDEGLDLNAFIKLCLEVAK
jgi:CubicO group peptidase (beta-lactamase class C family)